MKYLLTNLNFTEDKLTGLTNDIVMSSKINPRSIRYDQIPSLDKSVKSSNTEDAGLIITERVTNMINRIGIASKMQLSISSLTISGNQINTSIKVGETKLNLVL